MRFLCLLLFLFPLCVSAQGQAEPSSGSNVKVIQQKWRAEVHNPALDKDAISVMSEQQAADRIRKSNERTNQILSERGMPSQTTTVPAPNRAEAPGITMIYIYEVKISNTAKKAIRKITWDYVFFEKGTEKEVGRRRFESKVNISPGAGKQLIMRTLSSPTGAVDARTAGKKPRDLYSEQVVIQRVEYADGSAWQLVTLR